MLWGLICFVHPSQPLEEENNFEIWGARVPSIEQFAHLRYHT